MRISKPWATRRPKRPRLVVSEFRYEIDGRPSCLRRLNSCALLTMYRREWGDWKTYLRQTHRIGQSRPLWSYQSS